MTALLERVKFIGGNSGGEQLGDELPELGTPNGDGAAQLDPDPEPDKKARRRPRNEGPAAAKPARSSTSSTRNAGKFTSRATVQRQMSDELNAYAKMVALTWSMTDPECAGVLNEQSTAIAESLASLCARSDWLVERFQTTTMLADVIKLLHAALPLGRAVYVHHVAGRGQGDDEQGAHDAVSVADPSYAPYEPYAVR